MHFSIILVAAVLPAVLSSYCGQSAIPFTFQVLRSGHPVLGCARPKCFGWTANGTRAGDSAQFYRVAGKEDGYLRRSDQFIRTPSKNANFVPQIAMCADNYKSNSCEEGEWVGGLSPQIDPFTSENQMRCCSYQVLINSQDRGRATVKQGQLVVGGEVLENGRLVAFDYISNLSKDVSVTGNVTYVATIKRMPCFDEEASNKAPTQNTIVEAAAVVDRQPEPQQPVATAVSTAPIVQQQINPQAFAAPTQNVQNIQAYGTQPTPSQAPYGTVQTAPTQNTYGQFSQQGYGVAQNGQYQGYPQYVQQPQYYQDPLTAMIQQQHQAFQQQQQQALAQQQQQQQQQPQPMAFAPLPQFPQPMMFPQPQVVQGAPAAGAAASMSAAQQPLAVQMPITSTLAPMTLPRLEDLPKLNIPSVEDVEQVIPPVQRAILTSVAKFFGVL